MIPVKGLKLPSAPPPWPDGARVRRAPILTPERLEALVAGVILIGSLGYIGYHLVRAIVTKAFQVYG